MKILIIDDDLKLLEYLVITLESRMPEVKVTCMGSAEESIPIIKNESFDLLLIDYKLPKMNGVELIKSLHEKQFSAPMILFTGVGDIDIALQALKSGAADYLNKDKIYSIDLADYIAGWLSTNTPTRFAIENVDSHINTLYIEHDEKDIELLETYFKSTVNAIKIFTVRSIEEAVKAIELDNKINVVLTDLRLLNSSGLDVMKILYDKNFDIPVIIITGSGDEDAAVKAMKLGAYDYVVKRKNYLKRLPFAIESAIYRFRINKINDENQLKIQELTHRLSGKLKISRNEKDVVEKKLHLSEERYTELFENNPIPMIVFEEDSLIIIDVNKQAVEHYGYSIAEFLSMTILDIRPESEVEKVIEAAKKTSGGRGVFYGYKHKLKSGKIIDVEIYAHSLERTDDKNLQLAVIFDVTERNQDKKKILEQLDELRSWQQVVIGREERNMELKKEVNELLSQSGKAKKYLEQE